MYEVKNEEFIRAYDTICYRHDRLNVFSDFVKMCAISMYNSFAKNQAMEEEYLRTIKTYSKEEQKLFTKMFGELIMMYEECIEITDILGPIYMRIKSKDKHLGQVFTPTHVSDLMAELIMQDENTLKEYIEEKGFIGMTDPACGAGRHVIILCKSTKNQKYQLSTGFTYRSN